MKKILVLLFMGGLVLQGCSGAAFTFGRLGVGQGLSFSHGEPDRPFCSTPDPAKPGKVVCPGYWELVWGVRCQCPASQETEAKP